VKRYLSNSKWRISQLRSKLGAGLIIAACVLAGSSSAQLTATRIGGTAQLELSSPAIVDIDEDGINDVVFVALCPQAGAGVIIIDPACDSTIEMGKGASSNTASSPPLCVHVLNGASVPPYSTELPGFPRTIEDSCIALHPTVGIGDVNFDGHLDIVVGGRLSSHSAFAIQRDGSDVPGWESSALAFAPVFNAAAVADANADGAVDAVFVDESTYLQRFGSLGTRRQCQLVGDPALSSPAVGDVGRLNLQLVDGIPDEIGAAVPGVLEIYNSFGFDQNCNGFSDSLLSFFNFCRYASSPALADLDGDGTPEIVIQTSCFGGNKVQVFSSLHGLQEYDLPFSGAFPTLQQDAYSSPAVVSLAGDEVKRDIIIGTDSGRVVALHYYPDAVGQKLQLVWQTAVLDAGRSISASPTVADLDGDGLPEIVIANDAGNVYVLDSSGSVLGSASLLDGSPWSATASVWSTPAVWTRSDGEPPMIIAGNRRGVFKIVLSGDPSFSAAGAQWWTFHRDNARTGALPYSTTPIRGSVGGVARGACASVPVKLLDADGNQLTDYYGGDAIAMPKSDGRYLFEMRLPGPYKVRFMNDPAQDVDVTVSAGIRSNVDGC
jgi:hypothetical protein